MKAISIFALAMCAVMTLITLVSYADDGIRQGKDLGYASLGGVRETVKEGAASQTTNVIFDHSNTYFYDKDLSEAQRAGNSKVGNCERVLKRQVASTPKQYAECEAIYFSAKNKDSRPIYEIDRDRDPLIVNSKKTIEDADASDSSTGTFCRVVRNVTPAIYEEKSCMSTLAPFRESSESCTVSKEKVCKNSGGNYNYAEGGIDINQNMEAITTPHTTSNWWGGGSTTITLPSSINMGSQGLLITLNSNYSKKGGAVYKATYKFSIKNYKDIPKAVFTHGHVDDGVKLYVNGNHLYTHGWGSRRRWDIRPNLNILNSLKEGENEIIVELYNHSGRTGFSLYFDIPVASDCSIETKNTCTPRQQNENVCTVVSQTCTKKDSNNQCVEYKKELMCGDDRKWVSECSEDELKGCGQISSVCTNKDASGKCLTYEQKYRCEKQSEQVVETTECEEKLCEGDNCIGREAEEDGDFGSAISMMEVQRQAGVYGKQADGSYNIFKGEGGECTVKVLAGHSVMSCCKTIETGDKFQNRIQGANQTENYGNEPNQPITTSKGSQYVYDEVFDTDKTVAQVQSALTGGWLSCTKDEAALGVKRGSNLCFQTGEKCTKKTFFGSCLEKTRSYCCFKSTLARIINTEGRRQLGKGQGCDGFTLNELERLDFSQMDFSEFINEIVPTDINVDQRKKEITDKVNDNFSDRVSYYDQ